MADVKISALPAAGATALTDNYPVVQGGVTKKETVQQLFDALNLLPNPLLLGQSKLKIKTDGQIGEAGLDLWFIKSDGSASFAGGGLLTIAADGTLTINAGAVILRPTGEIDWANGASNLAATGSVVVGGGNVQLNTDGSASFSFGGFLIDASGGLDMAAGQVTISAASATFINYAGEPVQGNGIASIVKLVNLQNQAGSIGTTTLYTPVSDGLFRISVVQQVTTSAVGGTLTTTIGWTDLVGATTATPAAALPTTATGRDDGSKTIYATAGVPITYTTTLTAITTQRYALAITVERLL